MPPADPPVLVACAHGTRDPAGRRAVARLRLGVAAARPGLDVLAANVDVQKPMLDDVVARVVGAGRRCIVVPLLLAAGYHVAVDVARAVALAPDAVAAAEALGPDDALVDVLVERLAEAGAAPSAAVVLGAAGSSDPRAVADVEAVAAALARRRGTPVAAGYLSAATPTVAAVLDRYRAQAATTGPAEVAVATYLLAPGFFADRLARLADGLPVSAPLAPHPRLAELVLRRYDAATAHLP